MKRGIVIFGIFLLFIALLWLAKITIAIDVSGKITGESIAGMTITGKATSQPTNVSIFVLPTVPTLTIISPESKTYLTNQSLLLNYSATNEAEVWYNLDDSENITITSFVYFNATQGAHTLNLYANNSNGESSASVNFSANSSRCTIHCDEFNGSLKGESTNFDGYDTHEDLQNLSNITLENAEYGKIVFNEEINVTNDEIPEDDDVDIDGFVNVSFNRIEINSTALPNFNISSTLYLYNLSYTNPRILIDEQLCPSSICTINNYSSGTLSFNVTSFTIYSAEETPTAPPSSPPGGGPGGGAVTEVKGIELDKEKISVSLKQGETKKETITIKNTGKQKIKISLQTAEIKDLMKISEESFELNAGDSKTIDLDFIAREDTIPDLYIGKLIVKTDRTEKEILIAIEVESQKPLFDVKVEIPERFLYVLPGEEIMANIKLFRVEGKGKVDVKVEYIIKNEQNEIILSEEETRAVETEMSFVKAFRLPSNIEDGTYIFYVKARYNGEVASSTAQFSVSKLEIPFLKKENIIIIIIIIMIFVIISLFILYEMKMLRKQIKTHMKIDENVLVKEKFIKLKTSKINSKVSNR